MNRKGFTLIELIVVIAILGLIGVMVTVNLTKTMKKYSENDCQEFIESVQEAACTYAEIKFDEDNDGIKEVYCDRSSRDYTKSSPCTITLGKLYADGLIDDEVNKCTGDKLNADDSKVINIYWENGTKICEFKN